MTTIQTTKHGELTIMDTVMFDKYIVQYGTVDSIRPALNKLARDGYLRKNGKLLTNY